MLCRPIQFTGETLGAGKKDGRDGTEKVFRLQADLGRHHRCDKRAGPGRGGLRGPAQEAGGRPPGRLHHSLEDRLK